MVLFITLFMQFDPESPLGFKRSTECFSPMDDIGVTGACLPEHLHKHKTYMPVNAIHYKQEDSPRQKLRPTLSSTFTDAQTDMPESSLRFRLNLD